MRSFLSLPFSFSFFIFVNIFNININDNIGTKQRIKKFKGVSKYQEEELSTFCTFRQQKRKG